MARAGPSAVRSYTDLRRVAWAAARKGVRALAQAKWTGVDVVDRLIEKVSNE
jgi:hypothetical protein